METLAAENALRPAAPKIRDGVPLPMPFLLFGANMLVLRQPHIAIRHEGRGKIGIVLRVAASELVENHRPEIVALAPATPPREVALWCTAFTAIDVARMVRGPTTPSLAELQGAGPLSDLNEEVLDIGHFATVRASAIPEGTSSRVHLFVRAMDTPWLLRIDLDPCLADAFALELDRVLATLSPEDVNAQREDLDVECRPMKMNAEDQQKPFQVPPPAPPSAAFREVLEAAERARAPRSMAGRLLFAGITAAETLLHRLGGGLRKARRLLR